MDSIKNYNKKPIIILGGSCFLAYAVCYITRYVLSIALPQIVDAGVFTKIELGKMGSALLICYGLGQLVNGFLGNRVNPRYMVSLGLLLSGILTILFPFVSSFFISVAIWGVCGFLCSMLWGPMSRRVGENTDYNTGRLLLSALCVASYIGNWGAYILSYAGVWSGDWKNTFFISGIISIVSSVVWFFSDLLNEKNLVHETKVFSSDQKKLVINLSFVLMIVVTMVNGVVRNALSFWMPTLILDNLQMGLEISTLLSMLLPVANIAGAFLSQYFVKFVKGNYIILCSILFFISAVMFLIVLLLSGIYGVVCVVALFLASAVMSAVHNLIFSSYMLTFKDTGKLSGVTGFFDFMSYLTASVASPFFAKSQFVSMSICFAIMVLGLLCSYFAQYKRNIA